MDQRYLLAIPLSNDRRTALEEAYVAATGQPFSVKTAHLSLEFPFFLGAHVYENEFVSRVRSFPFDPFKATLSRIGIFSQQGRKIVHVKVQPAATFEQLHQQIRMDLGEYYRLDTSIYTNGAVPMYDPHITLAYNVDFPETVIQKLNDAVKNMQFDAMQLALYKEIEKGRWEIL